jgi:leader peptidase (prepilin peptidase)/N-methyltransferase
VGLFAAAIHFNTLKFYDAVAGALFGFFVLYIINLLYKIWRKVEGGWWRRLKTCSGAWLGWKAILPILMLSSGIALLCVLILSLLSREFRPNTMNPFS